MEQFWDELFQSLEFEQVAAEIDREMFQSLCLIEPSRNIRNALNYWMNLVIFMHKRFQSLSSCQARSDES